ncbi:hypothetical protein DRQ53_05780 [bacterium]|nr:MAG: hypothetical protein DRQ53_05780 [bacterium]
MNARISLMPLCVAAAAVLSGCDESITGTEVANTPPKTEVTATPPVLSETGTVVSFFWNGSDPDGRVKGYQWRISDNGDDGVVDVDDTLSANLPWNFTSLLDSTFAVSADLPGFAKDVDDSVPPKVIRSWQSHTFFVRAIDNEGAVDPTPATVSFTATTLTPTILINLPGSVQPVSCSQAPPALAFGWHGSDSDSYKQQPHSVRYLLKRYSGAGEPCLLRSDFDSGVYSIDIDDPEWSSWIRYDAGLDSGRVVRYPPRPPTDVGQSFIFAVQARDIAGAVTPLFEWGKNVRHVRISDTKAPLLTVREEFLGEESFVHTTSVRRFTIASNQAVRFTWDGDASAYGNLIEGYRYGFNLLDPNDPDDSGWVVAWGNGPEWTRAAPRFLPAGSPNFIVQAIDTSGQLSRATYLFQVVQVARRSEQRRLLIVDDTPKTIALQSSERIDRLWDVAWTQLIQGIGIPGFNSGDVIDAVEEPKRVNFVLLNQYRGVIWSIGPGDTFFRQNLAPFRGNANWLDIYQETVGNILFVGSGAMVNSIRNPGDRFPITYASGSTAAATEYPSTAWCLSAVDQVRPLDIFGEVPGKRLREAKCSAIVYAAPAAEFFPAFETSAIRVAPLRPTDMRRFGEFRYNSTPAGQDPTELNTSRLGSEEFYNANVTSKPVSLTPRDCQTPMYRAIARRDVDAQEIYDSQLAAGWEDIGLGVEAAIVDSILIPAIDPDNYIDDCVSQTGRARRSTSPISLKTIAIASDVFSGRGTNPPTKQEGTLIAADFLWGFNPVHFRASGVRTVLRWVIIDHWGVNSDF